MNAVALILLVALGQTERPRHPVVPSLPLLTRAEEKRYEDVIERFIQYDTGKLPGPAGKKAVDDFYALGPEAFFVLVDGFNRTANLEASCPAVTIGKKLKRIIQDTNDPELVMFAKETVGAGVIAKRHRGMVQDVQFACTLRRGQLQGKGITKYVPPAGRKAPAAMSLAELAAAAEKAKGPQLRVLLTEVEKRPGPQVPLLLATAIADNDAEVSKLGRDLLFKHLNRQPSDKLKEFARHARAEVRATAAQVFGTNGLGHGPELIAMLEDAEPTVQQAARRALVQLARGVDHGPDPDASFGDRETAVRRWREWWAEQARP